MALSIISIQVIELSDGSGGSSSIFGSLSRNFEQTIENIQNSGEKNSTSLGTSITDDENDDAKNSLQDQA